jgi:hypothetical protein
MKQRFTEEQIIGIEQDILFWTTNRNSILLEVFITNTQNWLLKAFQCMNCCRKSFGVIPVAFLKTFEK